MFFSTTLIAFLVAASAFAWSYNKFMGRTGNNTGKAITGAGTFAVVAFVTVFIIMYFVDKTLE